MDGGEKKTTDIETHSMMHVGLGRAHPLHVEYIHIGAALSIIQDILTEAILSHPRLHITRKIAIVKALGKVIWIQNDLFAKWYVRDGEEFAGEKEEEIVVEREGYLHGKKILTDEEMESDSGGDGPESSGTSAASTVTTPTTPSKIPTPKSPTRASPGGSGSGGGSSAAAGAAGVCPFTGMTRSMEGLSVGETR